MLSLILAIAAALDIGDIDFSQLKTEDIPEQLTNTLQSYIHVSFIESFKPELCDVFIDDETKLSEVKRSHCTYFANKERVEQIAKDKSVLAVETATGEVTFGKRATIDQMAKYRNKVKQKKDPRKDEKNEGVGTNMEQIDSKMENLDLQLKKIKSDKLEDITHLFKVENGKVNMKSDL